MNSVYIHIPFCRHICSYCDFCKVLKNDNWIDKYLASLSDEIHDKYANDEIKTIYIGGGTPSALNISQLEKLFGIISGFRIIDGAEFSFECNLDDIDDKLLKFLKEHGVNRLSIGIQSFNDKKLAFMERKHTYKDAVDKIALCRYYGFSNINLDLIYGIPGENLSDLKTDLKQFIKLEPEHISTYSLIVEDNTKIGIQGINPISQDLDFEMYSYICRYLKRKKFTHYEVSNFSKPGKESKHNLNYWNNLEYYGFGVGAHGYTFGVRYENTRSLTDYLNGKYLLNEELVSKTSEMENELMLGFRKIQGIKLEDFFNKFDVNMQEVFPIKPLLKNKDLIYKDGYIFINPDKIYLMNEILIKLI